jgi:hypothetical protein
MTNKIDLPNGVSRRTREDFDSPPCIFDEEGSDEKAIGCDDPFCDERDGHPKSYKHAMHDREKED